MTAANLRITPMMNKLKFPGASNSNKLNIHMLLIKITKQILVMIILLIFLTPFGLGPLLISTKERELDKERSEELEEIAKKMELNFLTETIEIYDSI